MGQFRRVNKYTVNCVQVSHWTEKLLEIPSIALCGIFSQSSLVLILDFGFSPVIF